MPAAKDASSPGGRIRRAGMLKADQPVYAASAALDYDGTARVAVYEAPAQARLWQGDTTIQADRLTVDDATGNLTGKGSVATTFMLEETDAKTGTRERTPTIGRADALLYDDGPRTATYTGNAHVVGPAGRPAGDEDRAVPDGGGQRTGARRGVRRRSAPRRHARGVGRSADVLRGRRALPRCRDRR